MDQAKKRTYLSLLSALFFIPFSLSFFQIKCMVCLAHFLSLLSLSLCSSLQVSTFVNPLPFTHILSPHIFFFFFFYEWAYFHERERTEETLQSGMTWEAQLLDPLRLFLKQGLTPKHLQISEAAQGGTLLRYYLCSDVKHSHQYNLIHIYYALA